MIPPVSPEAEANPAPIPDTETELVSEPPLVPPMPSLTSDVFPSHALTDMQERLQECVNERLKVLESQLLVDRQRYRDRIDEDLHKVQQQLIATTREQRQQQQAMSAAFRETVEDIRKEFSEALCRLSQDIDHVLRQAEALARRAVEELRDEMVRALFERDQATVKRHLLGALLITLGKQLQAMDQDSTPGDRPSLK